jgi:hypothetical protein
VLSQLNFKPDNPELSQARVIKQVIIVKHNHISLINMITLINYLMAATRQSITHIRESWRFESMYTLQRKTRSICHTLSTPSLHMALHHMYLAKFTHRNLSWVTNIAAQSHCSREKWILDYIPSMLADQSVGPHPVSLHLTTVEAVEKATQLSTTGY